MPEHVHHEISFSLFDASLDEANTDEAGICNFCDSFVDIRFEFACFACFREGKATTASVATEHGLVRHEDALLGRTHGVPASGPEDFPGLTVFPLPVDPDFPE